ncbi:hypothetical protein RGQ29_005899 [Quercus rubra]|uniref:Uncharacterized protein n=1 Tax=Quercus rubra TaxID=3512 RepID=A0AAN7E5Q6_QUERU|nr:hypothetical protein RGQ29_005899 [Quercus rubra]
MEEPQAIIMQINRDEEEECCGSGGGGDDFYEMIEAPKFVDLTKPDHYRPDHDDRFWFCLRVGCDQKHEEELDSEAIYKNFVLRVMAARSPNIRLRKALNRKAPSANVKCPHTAPPKSSKSRISRLALMSSISQKVVETKLKARPPTKLCATPNLKAKQSSDVAKALTTPRNRKPLSNPNTFRSVRNPKATAIAVPKNRVIAKALVFNSPKKAVKAKPFSELNTSVRTMCAAMKKLEIASGKKQVLGHNKPLPRDASRKPLRGREVKSRVFNSLHSHNHKVPEAKSSRTLKRKNDEIGTQPYHDHVPREGDDSSDMDIDEKSRGGSFEGCSASSTSNSSEENGREECLKTVKSQKGENSVDFFSDSSRGDNIALSSSEERDSVEKDVPNSQSLSGAAEGTSERSDCEKKVKSSSGKREIHEVKESDDKENALLTCDDTENNREVIDIDDKENALASDVNRVQNLNNGHRERITLGKHETSKVSQKVNRVTGKTLKDSSISAAQGVKYRKPKPTNPKPFRLRTDERRILKEANLEKKLAPLKEITTAPRPLVRNSERMHQNKNEKSHGISERVYDMREGVEKKVKRITKDDQSIRIGSTCIKATKVDVKRKSSPTHRRIVSTYQKANLPTSLVEHGAAQKLKDSLKKTKSPMMQQKLAKPGGATSSRKEMVSRMTSGQLSVIKETSSTVLTPQEEAKPCESGASPGTKASTQTRSLSRGRRPLTIPKEPIFHSIHVPKSCTRKGDSHQT